MRRQHGQMVRLRDKIVKDLKDSEGFDRFYRLHHLEYISAGRGLGPQQTDRGLGQGTLD